MIFKKKTCLKLNNKKMEVDCLPKNFEFVSAIFHTKNNNKIYSFELKYLNIAKEKSDKSDSKRKKSISDENRKDFDSNIFFNSLAEVNAINTSNSAKIKFNCVKNNHHKLAESLQKWLPPHKTIKAYEKTDFILNEFTKGDIRLDIPNIGIEYGEISKIIKPGIKFKGNTIQAAQVVLINAPEPENHKPISDIKKTSNFEKNKLLSVGLIGISLIGFIFIIFNTKNDDNKPSDYKLIEQKKLRDIKIERQKKSNDLIRINNELLSIKKEKKYINNTVDKYISIGIQYHKNEDFENAIVNYNKAIEISNDIRAIRYKGYALFRLAFYDEAIVTLKKAETISPNNFNNTLNLLKAYCSSEQYSKVISTVNKKKEILLKHKKIVLKEYELIRSCREEFTLISDSLD